MSTFELVLSIWMVLLGLACVWATYFSFQAAKRSRAGGSLYADSYRMSLGFGVLGLICFAYPIIPLLT